MDIKSVVVIRKIENSFAKHLPDLEHWRKRWDVEAELAPELSTALLYSGQGGVR